MKFSRKKSLLLLFVLAISLATAARGQDFWQKKPYQKWSEDETRKLLTDSPWAKSHVLTQTIIQPLGSPGLSSGINPNQPGGIDSARSPEPLAREDTGRARQSRPELKYQAQFRSALPIRQAIVRLGQINAKYDTLTAEQKAAFDKTAEAFLAKGFSDSLILYVSYNSNVPVDDREMARHWQSQTVDTLKNFAFLILPGGVKVPLTGFVAAQGAGREFQFEFPRTHEGRPLVSAQDKTLQLEFIHPKVRDQKESRVLISFKPEKMLVNGEAVY